MARMHDELLGQLRKMHEELLEQYHFTRNSSCMACITDQLICTRSSSEMTTSSSEIVHDARGAT
eukprot:5544814-Pleurochrysis_carterae.AAC.1